MERGDRRRRARRCTRASRRSSRRTAAASFAGDRASTTMLRPRLLEEPARGCATGAAPGGCATTIPRSASTTAMIDEQLAAAGILKPLPPPCPAQAKNTTSNTTCTIAPGERVEPDAGHRLRRSDAGLLQEAHVERHPADVRRRHAVDERRRQLRLEVGTERRCSATPPAMPIAPRRRCSSDITMQTTNHAPVRVPQRREAVADVGELREQHVERGRRAPRS